MHFNQRLIRIIEYRIGFYIAQNHSTLPKSGILNYVLSDALRQQLFRMIDVALGFLFLSITMLYQKQRF